MTQGDDSPASATRRGARSSQRLKALEPAEPEAVARRKAIRGHLIDLESALNTLLERVPDLPASMMNHLRTIQRVAPAELLTFIGEADAAIEAGEINRDTAVGLQQQFDTYAAAKGLEVQELRSKIEALQADLRELPTLRDEVLVLNGERRRLMGEAKQAKADADAAKAEAKAATQQPRDRQTTSLQKELADAKRELAEARGQVVTLAKDCDFLHAKVKAVESVSAEVAGLKAAAAERDRLRDDVKRLCEERDLALQAAESAKQAAAKSQQAESTAKGQLADLRAARRSVGTQLPFYVFVDPASYKRASGKTKEELKAMFPQPHLLRYVIDVAKATTQYIGKPASPDTLRAALASIRTSQLDPFPDRFDPKTPLMETLIKAVTEAERWMDQVHETFVLFEAQGTRLSAELQRSTTTASDWRERYQQLLAASDRAKLVLVEVSAMPIPV